jgi:hypothetical protein
MELLFRTICEFQESTIDTLIKLRGLQQIIYNAENLNTQSANELKIHFIDSQF